MKLVDSIDSIYSADSVEFCPIPGHESIVTLATYQVLSQENEAPVDDSSPAIIHRTGRLFFYDITSENEPLRLMSSIDTSAILDCKWFHQTLNDKGLLVTVDSDGGTLIWDVSLQNNQDTLQVNKKTQIHNGKERVLNLSVDITGRYKPSGHADSLLISSSDGTLSLLDMNTSNVMTEWKAHDYEAWIGSFDLHNSNVIYSGGDDTLFKIWDQRIGFDTAVRTSRSHEAGVCSASSHPTLDHILVTGSYDERILVWDTRAGFKRPLSEVNTGGGVWRLKWHPFDQTKLLAACMYNGFKFVNFNVGTSQLELVESYDAHQSIAYGADWSYPSGEYVGTCSFYDKLFHINKV